MGDLVIMVTVCTHIVRTLLQNLLPPELVVSEADPQWSGTKTSGLDVVLTLLQHNVFIIIGVYNMQQS